jgi:hypothetical protein
VPLEEIADRLDGREVPPPVLPCSPEQASWTRVSLAHDVELHVRGRRLTDEQLRSLVRAVQQTIGVEP